MGSILSITTADPTLHRHHDHTKHNITHLSHSIPISSIIPSHPTATRKRKADSALEAQAPDLIARKRRPYARMTKIANTQTNLKKTIYKKAAVEDVTNEGDEILYRGAISQEPIIMEIGA